MAKGRENEHSLEEIEAGLSRLYQSAQPDSRFLNGLEDQLLSQKEDNARWRRWREGMSQFGKTIAWGTAAVLFVLALLYGLNHFIPAPATETGTLVVSTRTPLTTATLLAATSTPVKLGLPRYENAEYGFHFNYPDGFRLVEQPVAEGNLLSIGLALETDSTAETGLMPINVTVYENFAGQSLPDWFEAHIGGPFEGDEPLPAGIYFVDPSIKSQEEMLGYPSMQYEGGAYPVPTGTLIDRGFYILELSVLGDYPIDYHAPYEQTLATLGFFEAQAQVQTPQAPTATPEPVICLDESAKPLALPTRTVPLEVRFISDGNIFVWQEGDAEAWQITSTGDVRTFSFSPDGEVIAFERAVVPEEEYAKELWAANRDGSNLRQLLSLDLLNELGGEPPESEHPYVYEMDYKKWVDGAHQLQIYIARNYLAIGGCCDEIGDYLIDADSSELTRLPEAAAEPAELGLLSPDGRLVALIGETSLSLMEAASGSLREDIFSYPYVPNPEGGGLAGPLIQWAHDSQSLLAVTYNPEALYEGEQLFFTWRVPVDGSPAEQLARFEASPFFIYISPNQQYFTYTKPIEANSNNRELHLAKFDGTRDVVYAEGYLNYFWAWAPDSYHFVYGPDSTKKANYGSLCAGDRPLLEQEFLPVEQVRWVDNMHFLFVYAPREDWIKELRFGEVGGSSLLIGPFNGEQAVYEYDQDPGALGGLFTP